MSSNQVTGGNAGDPPQYIECPSCHNLYFSNKIHFCENDYISYTYSSYIKNDNQLLLEILQTLKRIENKLDSWKE